MVLGYKRKEVTCAFWNMKCLPLFKMAYHGFWWIGHLPLTLLQILEYFRIYVMNCQIFHNVFGKCLQSIRFSCDKGGHPRCLGGLLRFVRAYCIFFALQYSINSWVVVTHSNALEPASYQNLVLPLANTLFVVTPPSMNITYHLSF